MRLVCKDGEGADHMFTWNLQFVSKKRLEDTLNQLMISSEDRNDILVRIHTAIHTADEAVDLAAFIKGLIPNAQILGSSTSAIISGGKLMHDQCLISISQMDEGNVHAARIPVEEADGRTVTAEALCTSTANLMIRDNTKLLFAFSPKHYLDIERFVELCNNQMPTVQMIGGVTDWSDLIGDTGFVFDENGWSEQEIILSWPP